MIKAAVITSVVAVVLLLPARTWAHQSAPDPEQAYREAIEEYRSGSPASALENLNRFLAGKNSQRAVESFVRSAREDARTADIEAALLLHTEAVFKVWTEDEVNPDGRVALHRGPLLLLRDALADVNPKSTFLRFWYLTWESSRQAFSHLMTSERLDFLPQALNAFPRDPLILLAAGSRHELNWWMSIENSRRDSRAATSNSVRPLVEARTMLRRSLEADPQESEARLRLVHVLIELNDLEEAGKYLRAGEWGQDEAAFTYLARLFEGTLAEREGNVDAAVRAYDEAMGLVPVAQSAHVAKAHVLHRFGSRAEAAATVIGALSETSSQPDPWWLFIRGQAWRVDGYFRVVRKMVVR